MERNAKSYKPGKNHLLSCVLALGAGMAPSVAEEVPSLKTVTLDARGYRTRVKRWTGSQIYLPSPHYLKPSWPRPDMKEVRSRSSLLNVIPSISLAPPRYPPVRLQLSRYLGAGKFTLWSFSADKYGVQLYPVMVWSRGMKPPPTVTPLMFHSFVWKEANVSP